MTWFFFPKSVPLKWNRILAHLVKNNICSMNNVTNDFDSYTKNIHSIQCCHKVIQYFISRCVSHWQSKKKYIFKYIFNDLLTGIFFNLVSHEHMNSTSRQEDYVQKSCRFVFWPLKTTEIKLSSPVCSVILPGSAADVGKPAFNYVLN